MCIRDRIYDVAAVLGLVPGVSQKNVGQLIAGVLQHVANVALALIVEEAVGCGVNVAEVLGAEGLHDVAGLVVQLYEVIRMGLALYADALTLCLLYTSRKSESVDWSTREAF